MFQKIKNLFHKNNKQSKKSSNSKNNKDNSSKKKLLKVITIISYILSFIFIVIMLVSCFKSCNSSDSSKSNNIPSIGSKETKPLNKATQNYVDNLSNTYWFLDEIITYDSNYYPNNYNYFYINFGAFKSTTLNYVRFMVTHNQIKIYDSEDNWQIYDSGNWSYGVDSRYLYISGGSDINNVTLKNWLNHYAVQCDSSWNVINQSSGGSGDSSEIPSSEIPSSLIPSSELVSSQYEFLDSIIFSNNFDWRILLTNGYQENTGLFYCDSDYYNQIIFSGLEFVSNNKLYNRIVLYPVGLDMATSVIYTEYTETGIKQVKSVPLSELFGNTPSGKVLCGLVYVTYEYWTNGSSEYSDVVFSCYEINWAGDNSSNKTVYGVNYNVPRWSSNNYKRLDIISKSDTGANSHYYPNISLYDLLTVNSNVSVASYGSFVDVFSLFASAFGGMTSIFAISVLPNITLGALLFLPLVVVLFITIIRLIKK